MNNCIKWFEIPARDFERAVAFYNGLLDLELVPCDMGAEKMAFFPETEKNVGGAVSLAPDFTPSPHGVLLYFDATGKLDQLLERVAKLGGEVVQPACEIQADGRGSFALFQDTEGNRLGFHAD